MSTFKFNLHILLLFFALLTSTCATAYARVLEVGPGRNLTLPSQAAAAAQSGDTIAIDAGEYEDATNWTANNLTIRGIGGFAHVKDRTWGRKAIWVIQGDDTTVEWIEFSGAKVEDKNGAGIRQEGTNLTVRHCYFHHNEMGILTGADAQSHILIEHSVFEHNGFGDGYSHNMYIGHVARFTLRYSYSHDAVIGHNVKSRAHESWILYNRLDEADGGNTSREIDVPNGGLVVIVGNILDHGLNTDNSNLIGFGQEGLSNPRRELYVVNNTFITARGAGGFVTMPSSGTDVVRVINNLFAGRSDMLVGSAVLVDTTANFATTEIPRAGFRDVSARDYRLLPESPAVDAGIDPGMIESFSLLPDHEYLHPAGTQARPMSAALDLGAFEYIHPTGVAPPAAAHVASLHIEEVYPNPAQDQVTLTVRLEHAASMRLDLFSITGVRVGEQLRMKADRGLHQLSVSTHALAPGIYLCRITSGMEVQTRVLVIQ
jgi:hypothetical protein